MSTFFLTHHFNSWNKLFLICCKEIWSKCTGLCHSLSYLTGIVNLTWSWLSEKSVWIVKYPPTSFFPILPVNRHFLGEVCYAQNTWPSSETWSTFHMFGQLQSHCKNWVHPFLTLRTMSAKHFHASLDTPSHPGMWFLLMIFFINLPPPEQGCVRMWLVLCPTFH